MPGKSSHHGLGFSGPDEFAASRLPQIQEWIHKGTSVGSRQQRAEALEHFLGIGPRNGGGKIYDALLKNAPGAMRAALARQAYRRKAKGPLRNEALAHFYGGWKANKDQGLAGKFMTGLKDMEYATRSSPTIGSDLKHLGRNALIGGAGLWALSRFLKNRQKTPEPGWPEYEEEKTAQINTMEMQRLLRRLKMVRGARGGSRMLRVLEARLIAEVKRKVNEELAKRNDKKKKK